MIAEASERYEDAAVLVLPEILGYDDSWTPVMTILLWLLAVVMVIVDQLLMRVAPVRRRLS